jgi:hypothetical protein
LSCILGEAIGKAKGKCNSHNFDKVAQECCYELQRGLGEYEGVGQTEESFHLETTRGNFF